MKKILLTLILLFFANFSYVYSQEKVQEMFDAVNKFYLDDKIQEAADEYEKILELGYESGAIYFNLGNAHYKLGNIGKAILYYEKAKKIIPGDSDLNNNLNLANLLIADKITPLPELFYIRYFKKFVQLTSQSGWMKIFLTLYITLCLIICIRILVKTQKLRIILHKLILLLIFLTAFFFFVLFYSNYQSDRHDWAVVMSEKVDAGSSPIEDSTELFSIHEGTKVKINRTRNNWIEISLPDGKVGWIKREHIEII